MTVAPPRREPIVITGRGVVSAYGVGKDALRAGLLSGRSAIRPVTRSYGATSLACPAAVLEPFDAESWFGADELVMLDPFSRFALLAAREAAREAGLEPAPDGDERIAVVLGTGAGGEATREAAAARFFAEGRTRCHPMLVPITNHQAAVANVSMAFRARGPVFSVNTGCASAAHAIAQAVLLLRSGAADIAFAGGSEANVLLTTFLAFQALRVLTADTARPFSRGRSGMALGEGAGIVVLETLSSARRRGARVLAELAGVGMSADAADHVHPATEGPALALRRALADAGLAPTDIGYVNAHGTGTTTNDAVESAALARVFGTHLAMLPVSSTKSAHGHAFGAAAGIELVATLLGLEGGFLPPTMNFAEPDPECPLDVVPNLAREARFDTALSSSFAFGGLNAVLAIRRFPPSVS